MLQADLFPDFKGADTLLLWGDADGMADLHIAIAALSRGDMSQFRIKGDGDLFIKLAESDDRFSELSRSGNGLEWACSRAVLVEAEAMIAGLDEAPSGHHYMEISGHAGQVIVSKAEYPASMRP